MSFFFGYLWRFDMLGRSEFALRQGFGEAKMLVRRTRAVPLCGSLAWERDKGAAR